MLAKLHVKAKNLIKTEEKKITPAKICEPSQIHTHRDSIITSITTKRCGHQRHQAATNVHKLVLRDLHLASPVSRPS